MKPPPARTPRPIHFLLFVLPVAPFTTLGAGDAPAKPDGKGVQARYVRVDTPTSSIMGWQEIEVISGGENLVLNRPQIFSGSDAKGVRAPLKQGLEYSDGKKDPKVRGPTVQAGESVHDLGAWFEVDLGAMVAIEEVILYGSRYPTREYLDKGHRVVSLLDENRKVVWSDRFKYYDKAKYPDGIFKLQPSSTGGKAPIVGNVVAAGDKITVSMPWLLNIPEEKLPPDAEERMKRFQARNSPEELKELADEFFNLLEPDVPGLEGARKLYAEGKYQQALDSWKRYWFAKMARVNNGMTPKSEKFIYRGQGNDLLQGISVTIGADAVAAKKITPGRIQWIDIPDIDADPAGHRTGMANAALLALVGLFTDSLLEEYGETGDPKYLGCWSEIMDDWAMNYFKDADDSEYNAKNLFVMHPGDRWGELMEKLSDLAVKHPGAIDAISSAALARVQLACLKEYTPAYWRVARETVFNHNTTGLLRWGFTYPYIDEFRPATRLRKEWREHFERWMTLGTQPDGSMVEMLDEGHFAIPFILGPLFRFTEARNPEWITPGWRNRFLEYFDNMHTYNFRHPMPGGYSHRFDNRLAAERLNSRMDIALHDGIKPEYSLDRWDAIHGTPEVRRIMDTVFSVSDGLPPVDPKAPGYLRQWQEEKIRNREQAIQILGEDRPGVPKINSDWMPYTGSYYFRGGWKEGDAFMAMFARRSRGGSGPEGPSWSHGLVYGYDFSHPLYRAETPLINGQRQNVMGDKYTGFMPGSKTSNICYAEREPSTNRWLASKGFDFGEAVYEGIYQNVETAPWKVLNAAKPSFSKLKVEDVRTNRQVFHIRDSRLFIFTDTTHFKNPDAGAKGNSFKLPLTVMLSTLKEGASAPFSAGQLAIDAASKKVGTKNPDGANVTLYQSAGFAVDYKPAKPAAPNFGENRWSLTANTGIAKQDVTAEWKVAGDSALVTVVSASAPKGVGNVASVKPMNAGSGVAGVDVDLKDGGKVWFQCAADPAGADLACGPVSIKGESLLVTKNTAGEVSGVALGAASMEVSGKTMKMPGADFEFTLKTGGKLEWQAVLRPISPVRFHPDVNGFLDKLVVEMTSDTPGVEIRYTTDGTRPTAESTLYKGPLTITETTEFAARAYRPGPDGKPLPADGFEMNGTKFTVPTYGWFYKKPLLPAVQADRSKLSPGLNCEHLEGPWAELFSTAHWMPSFRTTVVGREMDLSQVKREDYYYGARFKGYIDIPADGVYTFRAPREMVYPEASASYDLRLYIDGREWELTQWWHGRGTWTVSLAKGLHEFQVDFADARTTPWRKSDLWRNFPLPWVVRPGDPSPILVTGPGFSEQRIPKEWLLCKPEPTKSDNPNVPRRPAKTAKAVEKIGFSKSQPAGPEWKSSGIPLKRTQAGGGEILEFIDDSDTGFIGVECPIDEELAGKFSEGGFVFKASMKLQTAEMRQVFRMAFQIPGYAPFQIAFSMNPGGRSLEVATQDAATGKKMSGGIPNPADAFFELQAVFQPAESDGAKLAVSANGTELYSAGIRPAPDNKHQFSVWTGAPTHKGGGAAFALEGLSIEKPSNVK